MGRRAYILLLCTLAVACLHAQVFDVFKPDAATLNAQVLEKINARRVQKKQPMLEVHPALQRTAVYLTNDLRLSRFQRLRNDRLLLQREARLKSWKFGNPYTLMTVLITQVWAVDYRGGRYYYDANEGDTNNHLFYGKKPSRKDRESPGYRPLPVEDLAITDLAAILADKFLSDKRTVHCLNSGYSLVGCSCSVDPSTVGRRRVPVLKAVFILAGKRLVLD